MVLGFQNKKTNLSKTQFSCLWSGDKAAFKLKGCVWLCHLDLTAPRETDLPYSLALLIANNKYEWHVFDQLRLITLRNN